MLATKLLVAALCAQSSVESLHLGSPPPALARPPALTRRSFLAGAAAAPLLSSAALLVRPSPAAGAGPDELIDVYFGCGCFWHVQHELLVAERKILGRKDADLTARCGYAGGLSTGQ